MIGIHTSRPHITKQYKNSYYFVYGESYDIKIKKFNSDWSQDMSFGSSGIWTSSTGGMSIILRDVEIDLETGILYLMYTDNHYLRLEALHISLQLLQF